MTSRKVELQNVDCSQILLECECTKTHRRFWIQQRDPVKTGEIYSPYEFMSDGRITNTYPAYTDNECTLPRVVTREEIVDCPLLRKKK